MDEFHIGSNDAELDDEYSSGSTELDFRTVCFEPNKRERQKDWFIFYYGTWGEQPSKLIPTELRDDPQIMKWARLAAQTGADVAFLGSMKAVAVKQVASISIREAARNGPRVLASEVGRRIVTAAGTNVAKTGIQTVASLPVGLASTAGELAADVVVAKAQVKDHRAKNALGIGGSVTGAVAVGALVAGPVGAAAGAVVGSGSWLLGQGIKGVFNMAKQESKYPCTIRAFSIGNDRLCVGTYAGNDTIYWKTHSSKYMTSDHEELISASQGEAESFQVCFWSGRKVLKHFNTVFHRDMFGLFKTNKRITIVHCKGQFHLQNEAGKVDAIQVQV